MAVCVPLSTMVLISSDCTATFFSTSKSSFSAEESLSLSSPRSASRPSASFWATGYEMNHGRKREEKKDRREMKGCGTVGHKGQKKM